MEKLEADVRKFRQKAEDTDYLRKRIAVSCLLRLQSLLLQLLLNIIILYMYMYTYIYTAPITYAVGQI